MLLPALQGSLVSGLAALAGLDGAERAAAAALVARPGADVALALPGWNDAPCAAHDAPRAWCEACGVVPRRHQRTGITWLYLTPRAGLFDSTGLGKSIQVAGLLALLRATGEVSGERRALVVARAATLAQWRSQLRRCLPGLAVATLSGDRASRGRALGSGWEVALAGPEMIASKVTGLLAQLRDFTLGTVICDDIAALSGAGKTARALRSLAASASRVVVVTATPLDKRLSQLYDTGRILGWPAVLGDEEAFRHRYVKSELSWYAPRLKPVRCRSCRATLVADHPGKRWVEAKSRAPGPCPAGAPAHFPLSRVTPGVRYVTVERGVNEANLAEFRAKIAPLALRRTAADCDDVAMPGVQLSLAAVELGKGQAARYAELRRGVLTRVGEAGQVSRTEADAAFLRARQVTSSLACLDGERGGAAESAKLDVVVAELTGDLAGEPVVVYTYFRPTLAELAARLRKAGVATVRVWGEQHATEQAEAIRAFSDGEVNVMLITDAGGMGLNLQRARRMVIVDPPVSGGRLRQLTGRIARDGSRHSTCYVQVLVSDTPVDRALSATLGAELDLYSSVLDPDGSTPEVDWDAAATLKAVTG